MASQQTIELLVKTLGVDALNALKGQLASTKNEIDNLANGMRAQGAASADEIRELDKLVAKQSELEQSLKKSEGGFKLTGRAGQQLNYAMQDLVQGGLSSTVNNIPGLLESLGVKSGLAAAFGGATLAVSVLLPALKGLWKTLGEQGANAAVTATEKLKAFGDKIKELEEKPHKIVVDYQNLEDAQRQVDKLKRDLDAFEALKNAKTTIQEGVQKGVKEAIVEHAGQGDEDTGAEKVRDASLLALKATGEHKLLVPKFAEAESEEAEAAQKLKEAEGIHDLQVKQATERAAQLMRAHAAKVRADAEEQLRKVAQGLQNGTERGRAKLEGLLKAQPQAFAAQGIDVEEFGGALEGASAGNVKQAQVDKDDQEFQKYLADLEKKERDRQDAIRKAKDRGAKKAQTEHEQAVGKEVARFDDTTEGTMPTVLQGIKEGQSDQDLTKRLTDYYKDLLKDKVKPDLLAETAAKLAARAVNQGGEAVVKRQVDAEQANPGKGPVGRDLAARQLLAEARAKQLDKANKADDKAAKLEKETPQQRAARLKADKEKAEDFATHKTLNDDLFGSYSDEAGIDDNSMLPGVAAEYHKNARQARRNLIHEHSRQVHHGDEAGATAATDRVMAQSDAVAKRTGKLAQQYSNTDPTANPAVVFRQMMNLQKQHLNNTGEMIMTVQGMQAEMNDVARSIRKQGQAMKQRRQGNLPMGGF